MEPARIAPRPKKMDWTTKTTKVRSIRRYRDSESSEFAIMTIAILWISGVVCLLIPFIMYLAPIFFGAGAYYGWKIRRKAR